MPANLLQIAINDTPGVSIWTNYAYDPDHKAFVNMVSGDVVSSSDTFAFTDAAGKSWIAKWEPSGPRVDIYDSASPPPGYQTKSVQSTNTTSNQNQTSGGSPLTSPLLGGIPNWLLLAGVGVAIYFLFGRGE